jgi:hypothetical protein
MMIFPTTAAAAAAAADNPARVLDAALLDACIHTPVGPTWVVVTARWKGNGRGMEGVSGTLSG